MPVVVTGVRGRNLVPQPQDCIKSGTKSDTITHFPPECHLQFNSL
jgi:hypothetical protein